VQGAFALVWLEPIWGTRVHAVCSPVFHCHSCPYSLFACPIGILSHLLAFLTTAGLFPFIAVGTLIVVGAVFGSFVCGWACPFGFLQDLIARIPTPKFRIPSWMGYFRYVVLVTLVLGIPVWLGAKSLDHPLFFCRLCPAGALEAAVPYGILPSVTKSTILVLILVAMFFTWRPWCTVLCPLGAIYSLFNRVSLFYVRFRPHECKECNLCQGLCRYRGPSERRGGDLRCIRCLDCTRCKALSVGTPFSKPEPLHPGPKPQEDTSESVPSDSAASG
jgi:polyferredoxin